MLFLPGISNVRFSAAATASVSCGLTSALSISPEKDPGFPLGVVTALEACGALCSPVVQRMKKIAYSGYRFPPEIIEQARCNVSNRLHQPNASCPFTPPSKTRSTSSVISHPAARFAS